jgi:putative hydrolase of the HAD superfamily
MNRQTLVIDADDTLWENNIYFERAVEDFLDFLAHSTLSRTEVRAILDEIELANLGVHGYGSAAFSRNLRQCYEHLVERHLRQEDLATVMAFGESILRQEIEVIAGVEQTLSYLAPKHELVLFTKGHPEEQLLKVDRSGLGGYFARTEVVAEKDRAAYHHLVATLGALPDHTWMVGNSPKSDINPALAAGLNAVYIPHNNTWRLEQQDLGTGEGQLLILEQFQELSRHF